MNTLVSFTNIEEVQGAAADQTIVLKDGASLYLTVGNGTNVISTGATGVQSIDLGTGTNTVNAYAGTTTVSCHGGTSTINGGSGMLNVKAEYGTIAINAGTGGSKIDVDYSNVTFVAAAGVDTIDVERGTGIVSITGFEQGIDKIDVHDMHFASYADLLASATVTVSGDDTIIGFDLGGSVTLVGVTAITASDFTL